MTKSDRVKDGAKLGGWFDIGNDRDVLGELEVGGASTTLSLHDAKFFYLDREEGCNLQGTLHDRTRITLFDCIQTSSGTLTTNGEKVFSTELSPHYIVTGRRHVDLARPSIVRVVFHVDDAEEIFYDFDAMGSVVDAPSLINQVVSANSAYTKRDVPTGPNPEILYYTGKRDLAEVATKLGTVKVYHDPFSNPFTAPRFIAVRNQTLVELEFPDPLFLDQALDSVMTLMRFLELLAGRPQNIDRIQLGAGGEPDLLDLYWCMPPRRPADSQHRAPHCVEVLCRAVDDRSAFEALLKNYVELDAARLEARAQFSGGFRNQRRFSIERFVAAANAFDILPGDAMPEPVPLTEAVAAASDTAKAAFKALPASDERDAILGALGRLKTVTLRKKLRHRANLVSRALMLPLEDLDIVTDEAVKCRNHYIHGSPGSFSYVEHSEVMPFLTRALEFLFAASDLIDAGWDIKEWAKRGSVGAHPFNEVLLSWAQNAANIRDLRKAAGKVD